MTENIKRCEICGTPDIKSRRSCCGCGMRPGSLHNNGLCSSCQHPVNEAEIIARATGSVGATVTVERRNEDGTLTVESVQSWSRDDVVIAYCLGGCEGIHEANFHHEGRFDEGPIYIVTCPVDGLAVFVTNEGLAPAGSKVTR